MNSSAQGNIPGLCNASCNSQLNVSLDASGYALIDPTLVWEEGYNIACFPLLDAISVEITGGTAVVQDVSLYGHTISSTSSLLNCGFVGQNLEYNLIKYYSDGTVNSCWGNVLIEDKMLPNISCSDLYINCTENTDPYQLAISYNNSIPTSSDNCGNPTLTYVDSVEDYDCSNDDYIKRITRVWTTTDNSGNEQVCTQYIYVEKANGATIQFPAHLDDNVLPTLECPNGNTDPSNTGYPTLYGESIADHQICKFSLDYQDQTINGCGGSSKILRGWTVVDWCTNEIFTHTQIIKVLDKTAPIINCPTIPEIGTTTNSCTGNTFLPAANITDACSSFSVTTETPNGILNGNGGLVIGLPLGDHIITYIAEDECGNISSCSTTITIVDNIAPVAICDEHTSISLTNDGSAIAYANVFDDGSIDNCEIVKYEVRRMDNPNCPGNDASSFDDYVEFTCCDIGTTILVELKVTDASGNTNSCMVDVEVQDKLNPIIICPANTTLACNSDYTDLSLTGEASATDNCSGVVITHNDIAVNIDQCGVGTVSRAWTATDAQGLTASCLQTIFLVNDNIFDENDFTFPIDYDTNECGGGDLSPDNLPTPYDRPVINEDACDLIAVTYEDQYLPVAAPACFKILRKWTIVDWCQYDPNYVGSNGETPGRWDHVQLIKVTDNIAPTFTNCPSDMIVDNLEAYCGLTYVVLHADATDCSNEIGYTYKIDVDNNGSYDLYGNGNDASNAFENGTYKIVFTATDGCGNSTDCSFLFTIKDGKKPTPVCINGLSTDLMPSASMVTIWATDFESGSSYDNCTAYDDLKFSFSSDPNDTYREFTCDDLGTQTVEVWATDEAGNQDFCTTYIIIQDNNNVCGNAPFAVIEGGIQNEQGEEVEHVTIEVSGSNEMPSVTGAAGTFNFPSIPTGNAYSVTPSKNMNHDNGVSTYDIVLISKHILGLKLFDSPYKMIAADANASGSITTLDIIQIRKLILHIDEEYQYNSSWRFVDASYVFSNPNNPFTDNFPEAVDIANLTSDKAANFIAIKVGDVNDTAAPNSLLGTETRNAVSTLNIEVKDVAVKSGNTTTVDFKAKDFIQMLGFQFTLAFDVTALDFENVRTNLEGMSLDNFGLKKTEEGIISMSWNHNNGLTLDDEAILFSLSFKGKKDSELSQLLRLTSTATAAEAYSNNNASAQGGSDVMDVRLSFDGKTNTLGNNQLMQNRPNPVISSTVIPFELIEGSAITLKVIDINGKLVKVIKGNFAKGYNEIKLSDLKGSGVMYYQLETGTETLIKKMILVD